MSKFPIFVGFSVPVMWSRVGFELHFGIFVSPGRDNSNDKCLVVLGQFYKLVQGDNTAGC